ncbi:MAG: Peptidase [Bacillales bacterium]|jgi:stage IV sporulation protein FA|nr:Peptidase [Bacillales bacterium]
MDNRKEILRRIEKRKKERMEAVKSRKKSLPRADDIYTRNIPSIKDNRRSWNYETLLFRLLVASFLFLIVTIAYRTPNQNAFTSVIKNSTNYIMSEEFNFAYAKKKVESIFGDPSIAILPFTEKEGKSVVNNSAASGRVVETFGVNGKGVIIETIASYQVRSLKKGVVLFAGPKEGLGKTVVVQSEDGTEYWYGKLENIDVTQYDSIDAGDLVGKASTNDSNHVGNYYFAVKKGQGFIDPTQVIKFE